MSLISELMSAGLQARAAALIGQDAAVTGLSGAGTSSQANATVITSRFSVFSTVAANSGAILPERGVVFIVNSGANPLLVYPPVGGNINNGSTNASFSVTNGKTAMFISNGLTWGGILSA